MAGLIGLERELDIVEAALDMARQGTTQTILIEGELGSGRSTLLGATRAVATEKGMATLATQGRRTDRSVAYAGLLTLLAGEEHRFSELDEDHEAALRAALTLTQTPTPIQVGVALFRLLTARAEENPVCVLVDDEHLLDAASAEALSFALGRLDADAIASVATSPAASVSRLAAAAQQTVTIEPRSTQELLALLADGPAIDAGVMREVASRAAGNPLVAVSLAATLSRAQREGRESLPATPPPPAALVSQFEAALGDAGDDARRATVLVAADRTGDRSRISAALERLGESPEGLSAALEAGLLAPDGALVRLAHPLLQDYAYHQVGAASRRAAHAALAAEYAQPADAAERVWHLAAAADRPDDELARDLELVAAEQLRRTDPSGATEMLRRAAELSIDPIDATRRLRAAARTAIEGGDATLAWTTLDRAAPEWDASDLAGARTLVAPWVGAAVDTDAIHDGEVADVTARLARARHDLLEGSLTDLTDEPLTVAWDPGEMAALRARALTLTGRAANAETSTSTMLSALPHARSPVAAVVAAARADALLWLGDIEGAASITRWAAPILEDAGLTFHLALLIQTAGAAALARGDLDAAVATLEAVPREHLGLAIGELTLALVRSNQADVAKAWLDAMPEDGPTVPHLRRLRAAGLLGDTDAFALGHAHAVSAGLPSEAASTRAAEAELLRQQGQRDDAQRVVDEARLQLRPLGMKCPLFEAATQLGPSTAAGTTHHDLPKDVTDALSPAELRVATAVSAGLTNKEAAAELFLSVKTVDFHLQSIYRKLGLRSRTELAVLMSGSGRSA